MSGTGIAKRPSSALPRPRVSKAAREVLEQAFARMLETLRFDDERFFDTKSREWRLAQDRLARSLQVHQVANQAYFEKGWTGGPSPTALATRFRLRFHTATKKPSESPPTAFP